MGERPEHDSEDLVPELADESKVQLAHVQDEYESFLTAGEQASADKLVAEVVKDPALLAAAHRHMKTLRMRKAALQRGFRIGV